MQIVINIDDEIYKRVLPYKDVPGNPANDISELIHAIVNGVPLPKGHGRLIDADYKVSSDGRTVNSVCGYIAPTIIEADRSEEE